MSGIEPNLDAATDLAEAVADEVTEDMTESTTEPAEVVVDQAEAEPEIVVVNNDDGAASSDDEETTSEAATEDVAADDAVDESAPAEEAAAEPAPEAEPVAEAESEEVAESTTASEPAATADVGGEDELFEEEEPEAPKVQSPFDRPGRWYVVHTQSGHEKKAQQNLAARTASMNMEDRIFESVIPLEDVVEFRNGKKVVVQKKMFPGYLLVRAHLDDDAWYVVRNTPSIVNFVGSGGKPSPLIRREVENFLQVKEEGAPVATAKRKAARLEYEMGETVRVKEGPFADFSGEIVEINEDQLKVKVLVNIFGRETPVELEFSQIARL